MITNRRLFPLGIYTPDLVIVFDQIADFLFCLLIPCWFNYYVCIANEVDIKSLKEISSLFVYYS